MNQLPNIVFLFTDDQRFDTIHALGNESIQTPAMDRLVGDGVSFTNCHIPGGTVPAVCMPSRAMLHTGKTLFHLQQAGETIPAEHTLLGETLRRAGYTTYGTGKWHNGPESFARSFDTGDEIFFGGMADHWNVPAYHFDSTGKYDAVRPIVQDPFRTNKVEFRRCDHVHAGKHSSELFSDSALAFLRDYSEDKPYFMYVSFMAPHDPRTMPEEFLRMYNPADIQLPPSFLGGHPFDNGALHIRDEELAGFPRDPDEVRRHIAEYYAMISHLDHHIGRIVEAVTRRGDIDNTIFLLAGDNGLAIGRHGLMGKQNLYDHSVRVPLVASGPGIARNAQCPANVHLLDIFGSLCDHLGIERPASVESRSFAPLLSKPESGSNVREDLLLAYAQYQRGLYREGFKLIEYRVRGNSRTQLFDLRADPWETADLSQEPAQAARVKELRSTLAARAREWDDETTEWGKAFWGGPTA